MNQLRRALRDPYTVSVAILMTLVVGGIAGVGVGWRGAAASLVVAIQLPYIVSGALGGLAVAGFACALLLVQARRREEAARRAEMARLITTAADALAAARAARQ